MAMSRIADHVGRVLGGRYRLLAPIGTGGSAHVYLAEDSTLRRRVAVKLLHAALAEDESFLRRFRAEAQAAAALNHPNVMRVFDWGEDEDGPYLVLEHLGGGSLRDVLDSGRRLSLSQAASVAMQAAKALDYAHRRGLVHRDIKPANLLFDDEGRLCIADFGVARALAEATWTEPAGAMVGTARYAAPEQAKGGSLDGKADVYALALVLIEAVTGEVPFQADTTLATLMARVDSPVSAPAELGVLAPVIEAAGRPAPGERPDAADFARQVETAVRDLPDPEPMALIDLTAPVDKTRDDITEIRPVGPKLYDREADTGYVPMVNDVVPSKAGRRRRRWPIVFAVLLALLAVAGGAYAVVQLATPTHPVPRLVEMQLPAAQTALDRLNFDERVTRQFHETIAKDTVLDQRPAPGTKLKERESVTLVVSDGPPPRAVPSLANMNDAQARQALTAAGFLPNIVQQPNETIPKGIVVSWTPEGEQPKNTTVTVTVSSGPPIAAIPDVSGMTYDAAAKELTNAGFVPQRKDEYSDEVTEAGKVISTTPSGSAAKGTKITVLVSKGPKTVAVPDVRGKTLDEARAVLREAGLTPGQVYGPGNANRVIDTSPTAGTKVERGSTVDIFARR
jgi:eukaryotic-like serine/threonine-protein kinase